MKNIIVWYRSDLRVHDHPALAQAAKEADNVIPVFILNDKLLSGHHSGSNRNRFLLESLQDLKSALQKRGADLVMRHGEPVAELKKLIKETRAEAVYYTVDYTPFSIKRDKAVKAALQKLDTKFRSFPGRLAYDHPDNLRTKAGKVHKVFTPFWKNWLSLERRNVAKTPTTLSLPSKIKIGNLPALSDITNKADLSPEVIKGGETAGRRRLHDWLKHDVNDYAETNNMLAADSTSRLSAYLHFGCLSVREIETLLPDTKGARSWHRQLAWREFYHYIMFNFPDLEREFQEKYRQLRWNNDKKLLEAWQTGQTGYPAVDAAMRQLNQEGWMHNRGRLIVGSFLTKDLWLDWRLGEAYFMKMLVDGDDANNNGNWQWIASVGVDPAPVYRRFYNPASQQKKFDPDGDYVRRYVPELKNVPDKYLAEPWTMPDDLQGEIACIIGTDYPAPIVDHKQAREAALEHYRQAS